MKSLCQENLDLLIKKVRVRAAWIGHGSYAFLGSIVTGGMTGNPIAHWWVEIETTNPNVWFCAQFDKPCLRLTKHSSLRNITDEGLRAGGRRRIEMPEISNKVIFQPENTTIFNVYDWIDNYNHRYDVISNNCQHFGNDFAKYFGNISASNTTAMIETVFVNTNPIISTVVKNVIQKTVMTKQRIDETTSEISRENSCRIL